MGQVFKVGGSMRRYRPDRLIALLLAPLLLLLAETPLHAQEKQGPPDDSGVALPADVGPLRDFKLPSDRPAPPQAPPAEAAPPPAETPANTSEAAPPPATSETAPAETVPSSRTTAERPQPAAPTAERPSVSTGQADERPAN